MHGLGLGQVGHPRRLLVTCPGLCLLSQSLGFLAVTWVGQYLLCGYGKSHR